MSILRALLNSRQLQVLQWINNDCPSDVMEGTSHKLSALALQNRHLVVVSKKGGDWSAIVTDAGRYCLAHGAYPESFHRQSFKMPQARPAAQSRRPPSAKRVETRSRAARNAKSDRILPTVQLVQDVIAAGGALDVQAGKDRAHYELLVGAAIRFGKIPADKLLIMTLAHVGKMSRFDCKTHPSGIPWR